MNQLSSSETCSRWTRTSLWRTGISVGLTFSKECTAKPFSTYKRRLISLVVALPSWVTLGTPTRSRATDKAQQVLAELHELGKHPYVAPIEIAGVYAGLRDERRALE